MGKNGAAGLFLVSIHETGVCTSRMIMRVKWPCVECTCVHLHVTCMELKLPDLSIFSQTVCSGQAKTPLTVHQVYLSNTAFAIFFFFFTMLTPMVMPLSPSLHGKPISIWPCMQQSVRRGFAEFYFAGMMCFYLGRDSRIWIWKYEKSRRVRWGHDIHED